MSADEAVILMTLETIRPDANYAASRNYVEDGLLDSLDIVSLVTELEQSFGVCIDGIDIVPENFITATAIAVLVNRSEKRP